MVQTCSEPFFYPQKRTNVYITGQILVKVRQLCVIEL